MRVCANPDDPPASTAKLEGFDNRIAQILADELGATLSHVWAPSDIRIVRDYLRMGSCDLIMGIPDGYLGVLSTVPYYQIPHVFVYRADSPFEIQSLEDEALKRLRVSTYPFSLPHQALRNLGLEVALYRPAQVFTQMDVAAPIIRALLSKEIDLAILDGPVAASYAKQHPELKIAPVSPEIVPPLLPMFQIGTIGVRQGDVALRDRLNIALAQRWGDIQGVFQEYGIQYTPLPKPEVSGPGQTDLEPLRVGVVLPVPTGNPAVTDAAGFAARTGAVIAEDLLGGIAANQGMDLQILPASAPSAEAALRAAQGLAATEKVFALIGGLGEGQAQVLSKFAEDHGVLFFNIGDPSEALRESCYRYTFHLEASTAMYLDTLAQWFAAKGHRRWFFLYPGTEEGRALYQRARQAVAKFGGSEAGKVEIPPDRRTYQDIPETVRRATPDLVLSLLGPENQDFFLAQIGAVSFNAPVVSFPHPVTQTRSYWLRVGQSTSAAEKTYRLGLWEATLEENGAGEINDQLSSRTGTPMDPSAWAAYAAVKILLESILATGSAEASRLIAHLENPATSFNLYKGVPLSFRPWNHQLRQPLFVVQLNPGAVLGTRLSQQLALVRVAGQVPDIPPGADPKPLLDRLGNPAEGSPCRR
ncbi:ABC transporter substrate-binding protein [Calidithermus terrae]|nr:ABC transporter substrate-binding protein [Calidithermus terrae]